MNTEIMEKIVKASAALVSFDYSLSDPKNLESNMSMTFFVKGLLTNLGTKKQPLIGNLEISKRGINSVFESMADFLDEEESLKSHEGRLKLLSAYPSERLYKKLVGSFDSAKKEYKGGLLGGGIVSILTSTLAEVNEVQDRENYVPDSEQMSLSLQAIMTAMSDTIEKYSKAESQADPFLDCKRRFLKVGAYDFIRVANNPVDLVQDAIQKEIDNLIALKEKAASITKDEYLSFLEEKKASNGLDSDGVVMARKPKDANKEEKK